MRHRMSKKALKSLSLSENFENLPRPPVPGEENEAVRSSTCTSCKTSSPCCTTTCTSHPSKDNACVSSSIAPAGSRTTSLALGPSTHSLPPLYVGNHRSHQRLNEATHSGRANSKEMDGPEGSVVNTPPYTETDATTPPYLKWAENLDYLLVDSDGVSLFQTFLTQEQGASTTLEFWFACQGLKNRARSAEEIPHLIKVIHKKFLRGDSIPFISMETKKELAERLKKPVTLNQSVFDSAQEEVLNYFRNNTYPLFLKSDLYVQYVQQGGKSPKGSSNSSSGSNSVRPVSVPLPTLPEDQELNTNTVSQSHSVIPGPLVKPPNSCRYSSHPESSWRTETITGYGRYVDRNASNYPHHISYAPVSAQDSELHSLSSEATTDDTVSVTDSSLDGIPIHSKSSYKYHHRALQKRAEQNHESRDAAIHQQFIPRTERAPKDSNVAEVDTKKFASMLIERLEKIQLEQEREEKLRESIRCISESEESEDKHVSVTSASSKLTPLIPLMPIDDDLADSILEEHCSRIWESSAQQTPCRSPGRHSPKSKSPERVHCKAMVPGVPSIQVPPGSLAKVHSGHKKKDKDLHSMWSCDSGVGEDKSIGGHHSQESTHKFFYHHYYHHHHHSSHEGKSRQQIELEARKYGMMCYVGEPVSRNHPDYHLTAHKESDRGRSHIRKSSIRKHSDASSNIDSGISTIYEKEPLPTIPNISAQTSEKVLQWIMASDRYTSSGSHAESDKSSSHKRSHTHKTPVSVTASPQLQKQGMNKKPSVLNRSASAERGVITPFPWLAGSGGSGNSQVMPSQPIVQDPSMPLLTPPNPTTQLEEAKRRLENNEGKRRPEEQQARPLPVKSKSFIGVPCREKRVSSSQAAAAAAAAGMGAGQLRTLPTTKTVPADLDLSGDNIIGHSEGRKSSKRPSGSSTVPATPGGPEETVIGYFFCGEPIPYRHTVSGKVVTLAQFKKLITRIGSYRYFFKKASSEFESLGVVFDEIFEDSAVLPLWEGKVVAKVEKRE